MKSILSYGQSVLAKNKAKSKEDLKKEIEAEWAKKITKDLESNLIENAAESLEANLDEDGKELFYSYEDVGLDSNDFEVVNLYESVDHFSI